MTDLLLISGTTRPVRERLDARFTVHKGALGKDLTGKSEGESVDAILADRAEAIEAVFTDGHLGVPQAVVERLPNLRIISCYGVGYDNIDAQAAAARGIVVTHTPDVLNDEVANTAIALLLATTRRIVAYDRYIREGRWENEGGAPLTRGLRGKRVGMVGFGRIGQTIADKLAVFGCDVAYHARSNKGLENEYFADLVEMARASHVLIVITPGGPETRHLVSREVMEALGPEGTLVNVARGTVVDEEAMVELLRDGKLGAAGLDVFEREPKVPDALFEMENVVLAPHIGSATVETRAAMGDLAVDNLIDFFDHGTVRTPVPECRDIAEIDRAGADRGATGRVGADRG